MEESEPMTLYNKLQAKLKWANKFHEAIDFLIIIALVFHVGLSMNNLASVFTVSGHDVEDGWYEWLLRKRIFLPWIWIITSFIWQATIMLIDYQCKTPTLHLRMCVLMELIFATLNISAGLVLNLDFESNFVQDEELLVSIWSLIFSPLILTHGLVRFIVVCYFSIQRVFERYTTQKRKKNSILYAKIVPACKTFKY